MYGEMDHREWIRFLDSEIVDVLPNEDRSILLALSRPERPVPWKDLSESVGYWTTSKIFDFERSDD